MAAPPTARRLVVGACILLAAGSLAHALLGYSHHDLNGHAWGTDDAYISFRYARNLVEGHGLCFNPGERVQGYSNLLFVLLVAVGIQAFGAAHAWLFSVGLNLVFGVVTLLLYARLVLRSAGPEIGRALVLVAAANPVWWLWISSGMETPLVVLLQVGLWAAAEEASERAAARPLALVCGLIAASVLARADGFVAALIPVVWFGLRRRWIAALVAGASLAVALAALIAWQWASYGDPLPNTYYAKVSGPLHLRVLYALGQLVIVAGASGQAVQLAALVALGVVAARRLRKDGGRAAAYPVVAGAVLLGYHLYVGRDTFQERFLLGLYLFGAPAAVAATRELLPGRAWQRTVSAMAVLQLSVLFLDPRFRYDLGKYDRWMSLGRFLGKAYPGRTLAIDAAGKVPYVSGLRTLDMLGLNDEHIARLPAQESFQVGHNKYDADYVLGRRPDLIAAWVTPALDLEYGLARQRWEAAGYRLRYLVSERAPGPADDGILDVRGAGEARLRKLVSLGLRYGVLERVEVAEPPPRAP